MVSKRQKLARKRFKEENPGLFPKPEPTPPKDPNKKKKKKKKKKSDFKRKKSDSSDLNGKPKRPSSSHRKHPLRIPGMKPGDSCFICRGDDHIAKNCPQKLQWERHKICLFCRQHGHSLKNCPTKNEDISDSKLCYNCGESGHSLAGCPQPRQEGGTKFASCFVCKEKGHLSKDCPQNAHGIYPKGGSCKLCGGVTHLARDCPSKGNRISGAASEGGTEPIYRGRATGKVTKFVSGDDLEDDFTMDSSSKETNSEPKAGIETELKDTSVKLKKKQGPKVVNFWG